ncbi:MAG: hypothetical protein V3U14_12900 [candidate division NC10 bacterium]
MKIPQGLRDLFPETADDGGPEWEIRYQADGDEYAHEFVVSSLVYGRAVLTDPLPDEEVEALLKPEFRGLARDMIDYLRNMANEIQARL